MSEAAPITAAHAHARKAVEDTQQMHWSEAAGEHQTAAADFARAGRSTNDFEALRVLKLLEEQHQKLARILKLQDASEETETALDEHIERDKAPASVEKPSRSPSQPTPTAAKVKPTSTPLATTRIGSHTRDSSPSLARDIASRRGIPQPGRPQPSAAAQARARQLSPESRRRAAPVNVPKVPPSIVDSQASLPPLQKSKKAEDDEGFAKFYNNLTSGTISKLSSVLAFAGLPLAGDEVRPDEAAKQSKSGRTVRASNEPDVNKLFSRAALDAIEDEHRQRGTLGHGFGPAESFYVVPHSGGTKAYNEVAKGQHLSGILEDDDDTFVDAREAPGPPSPRHTRTTSTQKRSSFGKPRTSEELELENTTLKHTLEQLAGRLANFEAHAQDASMAALTQSMATLHLPPGSATDPALLERLRQLEQQVEKDAEDKQKLEMLSATQEKAIKKWEGRYNKLKDGAREKLAKREKAQKADEPGGPDAR